MAKRREIVVVGGGVIGLSCAYYLSREGHAVRVIEAGAEKDLSASFGNLGMVVPSHCMPLAAPGVLWQGIKWMTNPESPFYLRPRASLPLASWAFRFWRASSKQRAERAAPHVLALNLASAAAYRELAAELGGFGFEQRGLLMLSESREGHQHELAGAAKANAWGLDAAGVPAVELSSTELAELEPGVDFKVAGAVLYPSDAHLDPAALMARLRDALQTRDVEITYGAKAALTADGDTVSVKVGSETITPSHVVLAAGSWSAALAKQVGIELPLEPGKGYSLTLPGPPLPLRTPSILTEARVAITPFKGALRIGGTMELAGFDEDIGARRVKGIMDSSLRALPGLDRTELAKARPWHGFRPLSPDGMPYLGRGRSHKNLIIAAGHAMMGLSTAPISGKIVADLVADRAEGAAARLLFSGLYDPERYSK